MPDSPVGGLPDVAFLNAFIEHIFNGAHFDGHFTTSTRYSDELLTAMAAVELLGIVYHGGDFVHVTTTSSGELGIRDIVLDGSFELAFVSGHPAFLTHKP